MGVGHEAQTPNEGCDDIREHVERHFVGALEAAHGELDADGLFQNVADGVRLEHAAGEVVRVGFEGDVVQ